jgi:hypothetical protein
MHHHVTASACLYGGGTETGGEAVLRAMTQSSMTKVEKEIEECSGKIAHSSRVRDTSHSRTKGAPRRRLTHDFWQRW